MKNLWKDWTIFEKVWLAVFTMVNVYLFFAWEDSVLGLVTSLSGMLCVVLVAKGKIANYYFGIVQTGLYAYLSYGYGLYGETMLNALFYFPAQFVGLYLWNKNKIAQTVKGEDIPVKKLTRKGWMMAGVVSLGMIIIYGFVLQIIGGKVVWVDSATTVLSVLAQILMIKRYAEQWLFWIVVNILSIILWAQALWTQGGNDMSMLVMWMAFLINSIYGYYNWNKVYQKQEGAE
ncbi:nicotinamide mononucleotide transporter [Bacillus tianshenii]|uniref:Nicotinamide mononucleotide transporter n=1 Tax=Sutcliffiella tianshenii TaxID=1463404 RepID=A0ABS2NUM9_9BACI|nr:nicotinamide riboside transporter PnuC [Bacillus tianshenii]MBM7618349.1 nicotinamide mononucleotide transporter [Bacillus tianshenii]